MKTSNHSFPRLILRLLSKPQAWVWGAITLSILVSGSISWIHNRHEKLHGQTIIALEEMDHARIALANGFSITSLAGEPDSPLNRDQGLALLQQAIIMLEDATRRVDKDLFLSPDRNPARTEALKAFLHRVQVFAARLAEWKAEAAYQPGLETSLRTGFYELEREADRLDQQLRTDLRELSSQFDFVFILTLWVTGLVLAGLCAVIYLVTRAQQKAKADLLTSRRYAALLSDLLEHFSQPFGVGYPDGRWGFCNPAFLELVGYSQEEMARLDWPGELTPPEWLAHEAIKLEDLHHTGRPVRYEKEYQRKDGSRVPVELFVHLRKDDDKQTEYYYTFITDISERKLAESSLRESEGRYCSLFENMRNGFAYCQMIFDDHHQPIDFIYLQVNKSFYKLMGLTNVIGRCVTEVIPGIKEAHPELFEIYGRVATTGEEVEFEFYFQPLTIWLSISVYCPEKGYFVTVFDNITDRKLAEEALKASEEKYKMVVENANEGIAIFQDRFPKFFNQAAVTISGYPPEEFAVINLAALIHPDDRQRALDIHARRMAGHEVPNRHEFKVIDKQGQEKFLLINTVTIQWNGRPASLNFLSDITDRQRSEEALKESEIRWRQLFNRMPSGVAVYGAIDDGQDFIFKDFNQAAEKIEQISREELIGKPIRQIFPGVEVFGIFEVFQRVWRTGQPEYFPPAIYCDNRDQGTWRENWVYKLPNGEVVAIYNDITERMRAHEQILRNEARLRSLVSILQHRGETIQELLEYALEEAIKLTESKIGYIYHYSETKREFVLNTWSKEVMEECTIIEPQTVYQLEETGIWGEAVRQRRPIIINNFQEVHPLKKGYPTGHAQLVNFMTLPVFSGDQIVGVIGLANKKTDYDEMDVLQLTLLMDAVWKVVERRQVEAERTKLEFQLRQAQKMEAIGTLAGGIAHDFNNILAAIIGYTELAKLDVFDQPELVSNLEQVLNAGLRAKQLVRQILNFSRRTESEFKPIDIRPLIKEALLLLRSSLPTTIEIQQEIDTQPIIIRCDATQIHQVLMNLCTNAAHAMRQKGGRLRISLSIMDIDKKSAEQIPGLSAGSYCALTVSDTGHGMDRTTLERIFEPFFTTKVAGEGTGMGLSVVYGIVHNHHGALKVYSEVGKGSVFHIYLPLYETEAAKPEPYGRKEPPTGSEKILFVDDELTLVDLLKAILQRLGYEVVARTSSLDALTLFQEKPHDFDLIITDMTMPDMTGLELAQEVMKCRSDIPIILCTGFNQQVSAETALEVGIKRFLMKPLVLQEVAEAVRAVLDSKD